MAELLIVQQQPDDARRQLSQLAASHPEDPRALHAMGALLEAEGKPHEALAWFQRAALLAPDNQEYRLSCQSVGGRSSTRAAAQTQAKGPQKNGLASKCAEPHETEANGTGPTHGPSSAPDVTDAEFAIAADHEETPPAVSGGNAARLVSAPTSPLRRAAPTTKLRKRPCRRSSPARIRPRRRSCLSMAKPHWPRGPGETHEVISVGLAGRRRRTRASRSQRP